MSRRHLRVEPLETRRAPATLGTDGKTVTDQDADGDSVTGSIRVSVYPSSFARRCRCLSNRSRTCAV
jgi:hypothetical protein